MHIDFILHLLAVMLLVHLCVLANIGGLCLVELLLRIRHDNRRTAGRGTATDIADRFMLK